MILNLKLYIASSMTYRNKRIYTYTTLLLSRRRTYTGVIYTRAPVTRITINIIYRNGSKNWYTYLCTEWSITLATLNFRGFDCHNLYLANKN